MVGICPRHKRCLVALAVKRMVSDNRLAQVAQGRIEVPCKCNISSFVKENGSVPRAPIESVIPSEYDGYRVRRTERKSAWLLERTTQ